MSEEIKEIKEILEALRDSIDDTGTDKVNFINWVNKIEDCINDLQQKVEQLEKENKKLMREVSKLHVIQEEYGNHIENTHIIDDYQKTYFMSNKWLIELSDGKFVYLNELLEKNNQLENIIKEAIEFILQNCEIIRHEKENVDEVGNVNGADLLNILNKGSDKE